MDKAQQPYTESFFVDLEEQSTQSARVVLPQLIELIDFKSLLDVGCGVGGWSRAATENGIEDLVGVDGKYVNRNQLRIGAAQFREADLCEPLNLGRRFDLVLCLEVGEHLPELKAQTLVKTISDHADLVVFSAAIPFQGGTHHLNEQWPAYWADLFREQGFTCFDCIRSQVWDDERIAWWFRQNLLLFARPSAYSAFRKPNQIHPFKVDRPAALVHPKVYLATQMSLEAVRSLRQLPSIPWAVRAWQIYCCIVEIPCEASVWNAQPTKQST